MNLQSKTVKELQDELRSQGLPTSGKKAELIARLEENNTTSAIEATIVEDINGDSNAIFRRTFRNVAALPIPVLVVAGLIVTGALGFGAYSLASQLWDEEIEYDLIEYDAARTRGFAQALVDLGNPGRMSGTPEEGAAADLILENLSTLGYSVQAETHEVPMFEILSEPVLSICIPGNVPVWSGIAPCGVGDIGQQVTTFNHHVDYVLQGYSGSRDISFSDQIEVVDIGNGSEEQNWADATGQVAFVSLESSGVSGNTQLYTLAANNNVAALILWNKVVNCGKVESDDCVPIFKSISVDTVKEDASGGLPTDIPFMMVSNQTGKEIYDNVVNGDTMGWKALWSAAPDDEAACNG